MPAKPLTDEQKQDAERLKRAVGAFQDKLRQAGRPAAQDTLAEAFQFGQSAFSQYINGKIPLNTDTLLKFCEVLEADPSSISPGIAQQHDRAVLRWLRRSAGARALVNAPATYSPRALRVAAIYDQVAPRDRRHIDAAADAAASPHDPPTTPDAEQPLGPRLVQARPN